MMPMWIFFWSLFFLTSVSLSVIQPFIKALPLTALNDALRATILEGAPTCEPGWAPLLILLLWGGSFLFAGLALVPLDLGLQM